MSSYGDAARGGSPAALATPLGRARDLIAVGKPRLSTTVLFTTAIGMLMAPGSLGVLHTVVTLLATMGMVSAANALNCYAERDTDGLMHRTRVRPLPAGRLPPRAALWWGIAVALVSLPMLIWASNALTGLLGAVAFTIYVFVYTPMKQHSTMALIVGAVPGALPPAMGYTALTGRLDVQAMTLFGILFFWQLPHFLAVSLYLRDDYSRGGHKVFSTVHGDGATKLAICLGIIALIPLTHLPVALGMAGYLYEAGAAILGFVFLASALVGLPKTRGAPWARSVFLISLVYLVALLALLVSGA